MPPGLPAASSLERFGPESAATGRPGSASAISSDMRRPVSASIPLVALSSVASAATSGATASRFAASVLDGTAKTTSGAPGRASATAVTVSAGGKLTFGTRRVWQRSASSAVASMAVRASSVTGIALRARWMASVVPHAVVPTTSALSSGGGTGPRYVSPEERRAPPWPIFGSVPASSRRMFSR